MSGQTGGGNSTLTYLAGVYGDAFMRYALSIPDGEALDRFRLSPIQDQVTASIAKNAISRGAGYFQAYASAMDLARPTPDGSESLINALRRATGGEIEEATPVGDDFIDALQAIARDVWPIYLVRPPNEHGNPASLMSASTWTFGYPSAAALTEAVLEDDRLKKLFPFQPKDLASNDPWAKAVAYQSQIVTNRGGGGLQLASIGSLVLSNAALRCLSSGALPSLGNLVPHIVAASADLRRLADGETVGAPALVGLVGVALPNGSRLELSEGFLRPATDLDRDILLAGADSLSSVFETTYPMRIYSIKEINSDDSDAIIREFDKYQSRMAEARRSFGHMLDLVRLSIFLASPSDQPWLAREVARHVSEVIQHGGSSSWDPSWSNVSTYELPESEFEAVRDWHNLVRGKHVQSLDIGMRRLLSGLTMRADPIDAFVDAVICWESMFGAQTETSFRVTATIAKLLEPDDLQRREALHRELKDIYSKRSRLVHGGVEPKPQEVESSRKRAIDVAAQCFRILYRERPDLLDLSSEGRGARVLLE